MIFLLIISYIRNKKNTLHQPDRPTMTNHIWSVMNWKLISGMICCPADCPCWCWPVITTLTMTLPLIAENGYCESKWIHNIPWYIKFTKLLKHAKLKNHYWVIMDIIGKYIKGMIFRIFCMAPFGASLSLTIIIPSDNTLHEQKKKLVHISFDKWQTSDVLLTLQQ